MSENCNPQECQVSARVNALEREFDRFRDGARKTHQDLYDHIESLEKNGAIVRTKLDSIEEKMDELTVTVKALAGKPAKRWESIADKAIWAVCAAVITFLLAKIGL